MHRLLLESTFTGACWEDYDIIIKGILEFFLKLVVFRESLRTKVRGVRMWEMCVSNISIVFWVKKISDQNKT